MYTRKKHQKKASHITSTKHKYPKNKSCIIIKRHIELLCVRSFVSSARNLFRKCIWLICSFARQRYFASHGYIYNRLATMCLPLCQGIPKRAKNCNFIIFCKMKNERKMYGDNFKFRCRLALYRVVFVCVFHFFNSTFIFLAKFSSTLARPPNPLCFV